VSDIIKLLISFSFFLPITDFAAAADWEAVKKILDGRCVACHAGEDAPLGLTLDSHEGAMAGSYNGKVVIAGDAEASPIMHRLLGTAEPRMPLDGPPFLEDAQIKEVADWIQAGAPGPAAGADEPSIADVEPNPYSDGRITYAEVAGIFGQRCIECHSRNSKLGAPPEGLSLNTLAAILAGGDRIAVLPGNPEASELIRRVKGLAQPRMPLDGPPWMSESQIVLLEDWVRGGALDDAGNKAPIPAGGRIRFRGLLTAGNAVDGALFRTTTASRIEGRPELGKRVELRGRVMPDGSISAERLRHR
jgi:mono/diheme cytochrome c family protein